MAIRRISSAWGVFAVLLVAACGGGGGGDGGGGGAVKSAITSQQEANDAAFVIATQWNEAVSIHETNALEYTNHPVDGYFGGVSLLNGIFIKEWIGIDKAWEFRDMRIDFSEYREGSDYSSLTGWAEADGRIRFDDSSRSYSGSWEVLGNVQLLPAPPGESSRYSFNCTVEFAYLYGSPYDWVGIIRQGGVEWQVDSQIK